MLAETIASRLALPLVRGVEARSCLDLRSGLPVNLSERGPGDLLIRGFGYGAPYL